MAKITYWNGDCLVTESHTEADRRLKKVAAAVAAQARQNCPIGPTGRLVRTIRAQRSRFAEGGWIVRIGSPQAWYWHFVELGVPAYAPDYKRHAPLRKAFEQKAKAAAVGMFTSYRKGSVFIF